MIILRLTYTGRQTGARRENFLNINPGCAVFCGSGQFSDFYNTRCVFENSKGLKKFLKTKVNFLGNQKKFLKNEG